ncbi:MAG: hypothetical protein ABIK92_16385 [Pseudomonadota bacterium]
MAEEKEISASMLMKSTGLGETMLYAEPVSCNIVGDILVLHVKTVSPVQWHIRTGITYRGILKLLWCIFKNFSVVKFLFSGFIRLKNPRLPEEF